MTPLVVSRFASVSAAGHGNEAFLHALRERRSGLRPCDFPHAPLATYLGRVPAIETERVSGALAAFDCRNNRLAQMALESDGFAARAARARAKYGAARIAVFVGTSTSGVLTTEEAYRARGANGVLVHPHYRHTHSLYATAEFVRAKLGLQGPAATISTACSSSAKVFASAARMMHLGLCDAAVVGGVDSLCLNTLYGFSSLELVSPEPCRPCSVDRSGISIGEAAGFALLERLGATDDHSGVALLGYGESADAYHMSTPHPEGAGAAMAMRAAIERAGLAPSDIDYINLHGTASQVNDAMEDKAVTQIFGKGVACSGTKGWTGHALGAAGITEAVIVFLAIKHGFMPGSLNTTRVDPSFTSRVLSENVEAPVRRALSNSFGFGGSNCSLVFGAVA